MSDTVTARDVAEVFRQRLPGVGVLKLHKLLYYVQAHHAAVFGEPLFAESISAWDNGPVVTSLWHTEKESGPAPAHGAASVLSERHLNTIGYVLSRYGNLSGNDLKHLTHNEAPWKRADEVRQREGRPTARIEVEHLAAAFRGEPDSDVLPVDPAALGPLRAGAHEREARPSRPDSREGLLALL